MSFDQRSALLWDVVLGEASWDAALQEIATSTGAAMALMVRRGPESWEHWWRGSLPCAVDGPGLLDASRNPITHGMNRMTPGVVMDRRDLISDAAFRANDLLAPLGAQGAFHALLCNLEGDTAASAFHTGFAIAFPEHRADACETRRRDFIGWIAPLQRALRAHAALDAAEARARAYAGALSLAGIAAVAVAADLTIRETNAEAERILAGADGLASRLGRLRVAAPDCERRLLRRIREMWRAPEGAAHGPLHAPRRSGLPAYRLEALPCRGHRAEAIVLITDPLGAAALPDPRRLARRLGLTPAEARVACLAPLALTRARIAERLGVSENTVKTHLAAIRAKTGARNMAQLALLVRGA